MLNLLAESYNYNYSSSSDSTGLAGLLIFAAIYNLIILAILIVIIIAVWRIFTKAGKPGWAAIIPIYSSIISMEVIGRPGWWFLLYFVPILGIYVNIIDAILLARSFGKDGGFAVGLILLPAVFYPILGFGNAKYQGPSANGTSLSI